MNDSCAGDVGCQVLKKKVTCATKRRCWFLNFFVCILFFGRPATFVACVVLSKTSPLEPLVRKLSNLFVKLALKLTQLRQDLVETPSPVEPCR